MMLGSLGIRRVMAAATNVDEAMRILAVEPIDVVISDYRLGDETGAEFMRLVRSMQDGKRFVPDHRLHGGYIARDDIRDARCRGRRGARQAGLGQSIWTKLMAVTNARRRFVSAPQFFGPDRRRRRGFAGEAGTSIRQADA
jgi:two-component system chemotaxis response regulator CheY